MTTPPTDELTDERLAAIEDRWTENNMIHGDIHTLTQEVRRLRSQPTVIWDTNAVDITQQQRAEKAEAALQAETKLLGQTQIDRDKAEAEVERLKDHIRLEQAEVREYMEGVEAERDRFIEALKEIIRLAEEPHLQIARASEIAQAALEEEAEVAKYKDWLTRQ